MKTIHIMITITVLVLSSLQAFAANATVFGFWGDAMKDVGNGNYINQTSGASNVHYVSASFDGGANDEWREKVQLAKDHNNKVILMLEGAVFQWASLDISSKAYFNLQSLKNKLAGLEDVILGVYLIDEPYWKNSSANKPLSYEVVFNNIQTVSALIKQNFPNKVIMLTEAAPVIGAGNIKFPSNVDWIGANCYLYYTECKNATELENLYNQLYKNFLPNQKMLFTLDGHWMNLTEGKTKLQQDKLIRRNQEIMKLSFKYRTAAYFPFIYQSENEMLGTQDMPYLKEYLFKLGKEIMAGTYNPNQPINPPAGECAVLEPTCEGKDYVRRDSCGKELGRWLNAPVPYCPRGGTTVPVAPTPAPAPVCAVLEPTCEGKDYVRRDSCGKELGRWLNAPVPYCPREGATVPVAPTPAPAPAP
ncbi:MAG: hypothetical protein H7061_06540, partial [Bdellovibrionaceae bacterium]|nr:hypothetical protein [Bdellovibrio sp.]